MRYAKRASSFAPSWGVIRPPSGVETAGEPINLSTTAGTVVSRGGLPRQSYPPFTEGQYRFTGDSRPGFRLPLGSAGSFPCRHKHSEGTMDSNKSKPTPDKKDQVRKDAEVELSVEELEERIAPV